MRKLLSIILSILIWTVFIALCVLVDAERWGLAWTAMAVGGLLLKVFDHLIDDEDKKKEKK